MKILEASVTQLSQDEQNSTVTAKSPVSTPEAFVATHRAFTDLQAMGISDFDIFNALADFFYKRKEHEISRLMAEAAYQCFQRD